MYAITPLSEPDDTYRNGTMKWSVGEKPEDGYYRSSVAYVPRNQPGTEISCNAGQFHTPETARLTAAALLAAAARAQETPQ